MSPVERSRPDGRRVLPAACGGSGPEGPRTDKSVVRRLGRAAAATANAWPASRVRAFTDTWTKEERLGYPTQKPLGLLERIVRASSAPGDLVLDPFCGCGTTIAAANRLDRKWIGIDISPFAARLVRDRRLKDGSINIYGIPVDMEGARLLLKSNPFDFEAWIVMSIEGLAANEVQVGDRGMDGRGAMFTVPDGESGLVLAQVKGSGYTASALRDFQGTMAREKATAGVFVTLERVETPAARAAAQSMGTYSLGATAYPRLQFWSGL